MRTRTKVLSALAAAAVSVPAAIAAVTLTSAEAAVPATIPLTITNDSGRSEAVYVYVLGQSLTTNKLGYADANGQFREWTGGGPVPTPAPDVSIPGPGKGMSKTIQIPRLSGRVYFSFGDKIKFGITSTGLVQPAPWNPSDPNVNVLFDWSEYTLNDSGLWLNSSQVDMFAVPHAVSVTGTNGVTSTTGDLVPGGRKGVFDALKGQPGGWAKTVVTRKSDGTVLRALAPGKAADAGLFNPAYLDPYINQVWNTYRSQSLTVIPWEDQPGNKFTGKVDGAGTMNFTNTAGARVASFKKPRTADVWGCDGNLAAPNDPPFIIGAISRTLCAGFHRSTLGKIHTQPSKDARQFYQGLITNHYARKIHARMKDGKAYGFAFDDVGHFESLVHDGSPKSAKITLCAF